MDFFFFPKRNLRWKRQVCFFKSFPREGVLIFLLLHNALSLPCLFPFVACGLFLGGYSVCRRWQERGHGWGVGNWGEGEREKKKKKIKRSLQSKRKEGEWVKQVTWERWLGGSLQREKKKEGREETGSQTNWKWVWWVRVSVGFLHLPKGHFLLPPSHKCSS